MPYNLFWYGEPSLYYNYLDAYNQKIKNEDEIFKHKENYKAWLNGLYIDIALSCNHPLGKKRKYLNEPLTFKDDNKEDLSEELNNREEKTAIAQFMMFGQFAAAFNEKRKENGN